MYAHCFYLSRLCISPTKHGILFCSAFARMLISNYMMFEVLETSWGTLQEQLDSAHTLDDIINAHDAYLSNILERALLRDDSLHVLDKLLKVSSLRSLMVCCTAYRISEAPDASSGGTCTNVDWRGLLECRRYCSPYMCRWYQETLARTRYAELFRSHRTLTTHSFFTSYHGFERSS